MMRLLAALFMMCFWMPCAAGQKTVATAQRSLLRLSTPQMETEVPRPVQDGIVALKQALADQTDAVLANGSSGSNASQAKLALQAVLPASNVGVLSNAEQLRVAKQAGDGPIAGHYGGGLHVDVTQPRAGLLLVVERFDIACGSDNLLLVYRSSAGHWQRILRWDMTR